MGGDARGGRGPALPAGDFLHGGEDGQIFQNIREGIAATQMPGFDQLLTNELWQLVAYIRSLSGTTAPETVSGDATAGKEIFFGKVVVPAVIRSMGRSTAQSLRQTILNPNQRQGRERNVVVVKDRDGRGIRGLRRNEDTFSLQLMDASEQFYLLDKRALASMHYEEKSMMPDDYGRRLSATEIDNLVAYLKTLRVRDLAAVASQPINGGLDYERIRNSAREPQNWLTYWGDY